MSKKPTEAERNKLRAGALARADLEPRAQQPARPAEELVHELRVHEIELEMQNEELRRTQLALEASRDRYLDLYDFAPVGYLSLSHEGMIAEANLTASALLGEERKRMLGRRFAGFVAAADRDRWHRHFIGLAQPGVRQSVELSLQTRAGVGFDARLDCVSAAVDPAAPPVRIALADISERRRAEAELRVAATAFEAEEAMIVTDDQTVIQRVNHAFTRITGYGADEVIGRTPPMLRVGSQGSAFHAAIWDSVQRSGSWRGEILDRHKDGEVYPAWLTLTAVAGPDGVTANYVATFSDMTERKAAENEIRQLAFYDPLTHLPNRRLLIDRLRQALSACVTTLQRGALLFIDLDNFKMLNDTRGHDSGDQLLQQVARRLAGCLRESETVARLGGDEFVVLLENLGEDGEQAAAKAEIVGNKIIAALDEPYRLGDDEYHSTPSIGITLFGDRDDSVTELLKQADLAMYQAKAAGRNTQRLFRPEMRTAASSRARVEADLRQGLKEGEFRLHYQPQVDREYRVTGAEALLRWQHPRRGLLQPGQFIAVAEQSGLILILGHWVLETACAQLATWAARPDTAALNLAVNISAHELRHPQFVEHVMAVVDRTGIDARRLRLELTESTLLDNVEDTIAKMSALKARDVRFSLDDFGTGYSSLSYLKRLLLYQVKIDRSFVRDALTDPDAATIARTVVALARSLGLSVIAEGVETEAQRDFLADLGCDLYQGYLFGRPGPIEALRAPAWPAS